MKYERITITRFKISGSFIAVIAVVILLAANHKSVGPALHTLTEIIMWTAISVGIIATTAIALLVRRAIKRARTGSYVPVKRVTLYPEYTLNSKPVAEIEPKRITLNGINYVEVKDRN